MLTDITPAGLIEGGHSQISRPSLRTGFYSTSTLPDPLPSLLENQGVKLENQVEL